MNNVRYYNIPGHRCGMNNITYDSIKSIYNGVQKSSANTLTPIIAPCIDIQNRIIRFSNIA